MFYFKFEKKNLIQIIYLPVINLKLPLRNFFKFINKVKLAVCRQFLIETIIVINKQNKK